MNKNQHTVTADEQDIRLDRWMKTHVPEIPFGMLQRLLRTGQIRRNGKRCKGVDRLDSGDIIRLPPQIHESPPPTAHAKHRTPAPHDVADIRAMVLFENDAFYVLNKPPGLAAQGGPKTKKHLDGMLRALETATVQPRLVHRLDRDTSGIMVVAKTRTAAADMMRLFQKRQVQKTYWALTEGVPPTAQGTIRKRLTQKGSRGEEKVVVDPDGQTAVTHYAVADTLDKILAWVVASPATGRKHQIRAHLAAIGCPIAGDHKYGGGAVKETISDLPDGLFLHARRITFPFKGKTYTFDAPPPRHFQQAWTYLGFEAETDVTALR